MEVLKQYQTDLDIDMQSMYIDGASRKHKKADTTAESEFGEIQGNGWF